tara:strand:- start:77 stop:1267 length:1191 start_codon:yes stop_codon:yes gene_type:complete
MWYRIFDISEMIDRTYGGKGYSSKNVASDNKYFTDMLSKNSPMIKDDPGYGHRLNMITYSDMDNWPGWDGSGGNCSPDSKWQPLESEDSATNFRRHRDSWIKDSTDYVYAYQKGLTGDNADYCWVAPYQTVDGDYNNIKLLDFPSVGGVNVGNEPTLPLAYHTIYRGRQPLNAFPFYLGPDTRGVFGWTSPLKFGQTRPISELTYDDDSLVDIAIAFQYLEVNTWVRTPFLIYVKDSGTYADGTCKRITSIPIINSGTGYAVGDPVTITNGIGGVGTGCQPTVSETGTNGEILKITINNVDQIAGGQYYQAGVTATMATSQGNNDAVLGTPVLEVGQWIELESWNLGLGYDFSDVWSTVRSRQDSWVKLFNEMCIGSSPFWSSAEFAQFQFDKYLT